MTADDLLKAAKQWTQPPAAPDRTRASYRIYLPAIEHLSAQNWRPLRIKEALAKEANLEGKAADRLYDFICRQLRPKAPRKPRS